MTAPAAPYTFSRRGRSWPTLLTLLGTWALLLVLLLRFEAALWLVALFFLFSLPAAWDLWSDRRAGLALGDRRIRWFSGNREADVRFDEVDHVRLVTRLDMSVRAALVLHTGRKVRLPAEATPPAAEFEAALAAHDLRAERHHFTFL